MEPLAEIKKQICEIYILRINSLHNRVSHRVKNYRISYLESFCWPGGLFCLKHSKTPITLKSRF